MSAQTRLQSLVETLLGVAIGMAISIWLSTWLYPLFGHAFTLGENAGLTAVFTVVSIARSYVLRRAFNWWHHRSV